MAVRSIEESRRSLRVAGLRALPYQSRSHPDNDARSRLIREVQGNFDQLMGNTGDVADRHNALVEYVLALAEQLGLEEAEELLAGTAGAGRVAYNVGDWIGPLSSSGTPFPAGGLPTNNAAGWFVALPVHIIRPTTFDKLIFGHTTTAGVGAVRLGLYADDDWTGTGAPLFDVSTGVGISANWQEVVLSLRVETGLYWMASLLTDTLSGSWAQHNSLNVTEAGRMAWRPNEFTTAQSVGTASRLISREASGVATGALPDPFPAQTYPVATNRNSPGFLLHVSAVE